MWLLAHRTRLDYTKRLQDCTHVVPPTMYNTHWLLCCSRWYNFFPSPTGVRTVCMCCQNMQSKMPPSSSTSWWRLPQTTPSTSKMLRETQVHSSCLTCATAFHSCLFIAGPFLCRSGELGNRDTLRWWEIDFWIDNLSSKIIMLQLTGPAVNGNRIWYSVTSW